MKKKHFNINTAVNDPYDTDPHSLVLYGSFTAMLI